MLLSNMQDNIIKAPIVMASHAAAAEKARLEAAEHQAETLERVRQAEEAVNELKQSEQEGIRRESENPEEVNPDGQGKKRQRKQSAAPAGDEGSIQERLDYRPIAPPPPPPADGHTHIDVTI
ncbi:MAG: hypothetical protein ACYTGH_02260 [Planctomycetota bacterium]|jgi:hypothetical protein